ncbi:MAG TPA: hypothetical protein VIF60_16790 [Burkholderiaceae bacterium]|jgi:hypothetical protein
MLDRIQASDFSHATGKICTLHLPDGVALPVLVDNVSVKEQYRNPYAKEGTRLPFIANLIAQQATEFLNGTCHFEFEDGSRIENIDVSRVAPLGRDPTFAYYQIIFN